MKCMQVQHAALLVSYFDLGLPLSDAAGLWQAAAAEERREALFGPAHL
jgi:hypothetical protein